MIAVDIVLLPPRHIMDMAISENRILVAQGNPQIILDQEQTLPHISLVMGCMPPELASEVQTVIGDAIALSPPGQLTITGIAIMTNRFGHKISSLIIHKSDALQTLHELLMKRTSGLFVYQPQPHMIYGDGPVSQTTLEWIRSFREHAAFHRFWPHITLGYGIARPIDRQSCFYPDAIALCHLGNHCTCQKVLTRIPLKED